MTDSRAQSWLSSRHDVIPALEIHHSRALAILENHTRTVRDLADIIALDPGMSVSLYQEVNGKLHRHGKSAVDSVHGALGLLGDGAIADLVMQHPVLDRTHPDPVRRQAYHQLMSRSYFLLALLDDFIGLQGIQAVNEIRSAALLHNIGEICACLFDQAHYREYQAQFHRSGAETNAARNVFGFDFHQLGRLYAKKTYLPPLVGESLDENIPPGRKARLIQLAAEIAHQADEGWEHSAMRAAAEISAGYLNQSLDGFEKHLQQIAIDAARNCPFDDVLPAASRLIMLPDDKRQSYRPASSPPPGPVGEFGVRLGQLLQAPRVTQAKILELLMIHLHRDLHLSRVVLLLLSADRSKIGTRAGKGIDEKSPVRNLVINLGNASLLRSLLGKPQAVWIDSDNYRRYEAALPKRFRDAFLHENFFLMSLFVGDRPLGLIFADRALAVTQLDKATYLKFKSATLLTTRALTELARRRSSSAA